MPPSAHAGTRYRPREARTAALNRLLRAVSEANQLVIRERDRGRLLDGLCRVVVEHGGFRMAWVGLVDEATREVHPVAVAGHDEGYVAGVRVVLDGSERSRGPTGRAIMERRPQVLDDMAADPRFGPWREAALARGYRTSAVFPLLEKERAWGALSVYAGEPGVFGGEVVPLLEQLASNVAHALDTLEAEEARHEAERRLRRASAYNRTLIETSLDPLVTISPGGKITDVNAATEEVTGVSRESLVGSDFSDYFTEPERAREGYRRVLAVGEVRDYPLVVRHVSGRTTHVLYNASVYRDDSGAVKGVFAAARDVTERRAAEEAARRASTYARSLIEASLDPLVTIDPEGKIRDVNRATESATGLPRAHLIGTDFSDYFTEPERAREGYRRVLAEGVVRDYALTLRRASGTTIDVLYNATIYRGEEGRVEGIFAAARDVTERRKAEAQREEAMRDLERSNRELEQFAYVASHDLQEPLRMVASFTQLLAQRYGDRLDTDAHEFIGYAVDGANRMQRLINDLLAYSRISTRGRPPAPVDSHAALGQAIVNLTVAIRESGAMVVSDELPAVLADEGQLVQLFQNLVGNAVKFHRREEPPRVRISAAREGRFWRFAVADNGIGIAPEFHARIFVVFQRLHTRTEYPGTGIGLAICKRIVERHGGRIWLESEPGAGSTFFFTLPACD